MFRLAGSFDYLVNSITNLIWIQIDNWETKLYFNTITHTMDDTKRPDVPIHMDMLGLERYSMVLFQK